MPMMYFMKYFVATRCDDVTVGSKDFKVILSRIFTGHENDHYRVGDDILSS